MRVACTYRMEAHVSTRVPADWRLSTFSTFSFGGAAAFSSVAASAFSVCLRSRRVDMRSDIAAELASGGGGWQKNAGKFAGGVNGTYANRTKRAEWHLPQRTGGSERRLSGVMREPEASCWRDRLTVIITTSPLPRHPCSSMLEAILLSLRGFGGLAGCRTLIVADGYDASAVEGQAVPHS